MEGEQDTSMAAAVDEQAADLAALQAAAGGAPGPQGGAVAEQQAEGPPPPSAAAMQMAAMAVGIMKPIICFAVPSLREAPSELWEPIPEGVAAVMDHYGASAEWMNSPWARLGLSLAPLACFAAVEAMKDKPKAEPQAQAISLEAKAPDVVAGSKTVTFGAPAVEGAA